MKKLVAGLMAASILVGGLAGCSAKEDKEGESKDKGGKELRLMMSSGDFGANTIKPALEKAAEIMGIEIKYDVIPDDQMLNVLNTQLATGNSNDIIIHNFGLTDISSDNLEPLSGEWTEKITSTTKPLCVGESGEVLKAPLGGESNMGLLYNKEVLEDCGIDVPMKNYDEFIQACEKIKEKGYIPVYISNKEVWTAQILLMTTMTSTFADNPEIINAIVKNEKKPADIPELKKLWENAVSLKEKGFINEDYMSATNDMGLEAVAGGQCAFYAQMDNTYGTISESYPDAIEHIGMMYTPLWNDESQAYVLFDSATNYISVAKDGEQVELAKEFVNTLLTEEPMTVYYNTNPGAAPYEDLGFELKANAFNEEMLGYAEQLPRYGTFNNNSYDGEVPLEAFYGALSEQVQGLFSGKSVEEAMNSWYNAYSEDAKARGIEEFQ